MRILYFGDIVGRNGREAVIARAPELRERLKIDFMLACGENAASGFGITAKICEALYAAGIECITLGNHAWDQREIIGYIDGDPKLLRPANYPDGTPGRGLAVYDAAGGRKVMVVQIMTRLFMDPLDDPFRVLDEALRTHRLGHAVDAIVVDLHGEATSEKMALGHHVDGRASMAVGTHTHVPTADTLIMPGGTAYQTDIGMCGAYDSVIGFKKEIAVARFTRKMPGERLSPAESEATVCAVFVETDDRTGLATTVAPVRVGGDLPETLPDI